VNIMPGKGFENVGLPREMIEYIDELISNSEIKKAYGFKSRAEFVRYATSKLIKELEEELRSPLKKLVE